MFGAPVMAGLLVASALTVEVVPQSGAAVSGALIAVDAAQLKLQTDSGERSFPLKTLRKATVKGRQALSALNTPIEAELSCGSRIRARQFLATEEQAQFTPSWDGELTGPSRGVRWVLLQPLPAEGEARGNWEAFRNQETPGDKLVFRPKGDAGNLDQLEGTLLKVGQDDVTFRFQEQAVSPKRERVVGLIYFQRKRTLPAPLCGLRLTDGSQLVVSAWTAADGHLSVTTPSGHSVDVPHDLVMSLEFGSGNVAFLSDLAPESQEYEPFFGAIVASFEKLNQPRADRGIGFDKSELKLLNRDVAEKGLAVRSGSRLVYRLPREFRRLQATVGFHEQVTGGVYEGRLELRILGDDGKLLEQHVLVDSDEPLELNTDIAGVRRLTVEVNYLTGQDLGDFLILSDARLLK